MVSVQTLSAIRRLHLAASGCDPLHLVQVRAGDLVALCNGFWEETKRADVADAQRSRAIDQALESLLAARSAASKPLCSGGCAARR